MAFVKHCARALALIVMAVALSLPAAAQNSSLRLAENDIKAGLLYNFLRYTHWPTETRNAQPAVVCIYGSDPFSGRLTPMAGRTVNQRSIEVRSVRTYGEMNSCSLLVVNAAERTRWPQMRAYLSERDVLTVSDYDGFARAGGMIEFTRTNNRIGVRVNTGAIERADLIVQERILRLASAVRTDAP